MISKKNDTVKMLAFIIVFLIASIPLTIFLLNKSFNSKLEEQAEGLDRILEDREREFEKATNKIETNLKVKEAELESKTNRLESSIREKELAFSNRADALIERLGEDVSERIFSEKSKSIVLIKIGSYSHGTGFFVNTSGLIMTNFHVIERSGVSQITITDNLKKQYDTRIVAVDEENDLALLKIEKTSIPITFSRNQTTGEEIYALGYSLTNILTIKEGIVARKFAKKIEITAEINQGMSGGPALNKNGELVGVNVGGANLGGGDIIKFIIPSNIVKTFLDENANTNTNHATHRAVSRVFDISTDEAYRKFTSMATYYDNFDAAMLLATAFYEELVIGFRENICQSKSTDYAFISRLENLKDRFKDIIEEDISSLKQDLKGLEVEIGRINQDFSRMRVNMNRTSLFLEKTQNFIGNYNEVVDDLNKNKIELKEARARVNKLEDERSDNCNEALDDGVELEEYLKTNNEKYTVLKNYFNNL